ncbi:MAG: hypothetical protein L0H73_17510 [Nitrococcus sp.]|nr:hypothetical protein [Nitrococcus sp.]
MAADATSEFQIDSEQLYQEEVFTDRRVGSILRLTPVRSDGTRDTGRAVVFLGQTQVLTQAGALPINFEIKADTLEQATEQFDRGAEKAVDETLEQLKQLQREAASSIVVPGSGAGGAASQGALGGGILGGGGIKRR